MTVPPSVIITVQGSQERKKKKETIFFGVGFSVVASERYECAYDTSSQVLDIELECALFCATLWDGKRSKTIKERKKDLQTRAIDISGLVSVGRGGEAGGGVGGLSAGVSTTQLRCVPSQSRIFNVHRFVVYARYIRDEWTSAPRDAVCNPASSQSDGPS